MKRGTKASFSFKVLGRNKIFEELHGVDVVAQALVEEVSILTPSVRPCEPLAEVTLLQRSSPATVPTSDRAVAGEVIPDYTHDYTDPHFAAYAAERAKQGILVRRGIGQVLGVR